MVRFDGIPIGASVSAKTRAYYKDGNNRIMLCTGESESITVQKDDHSLDITMEWLSVAKDVGDIVFADGSATPYYTGLELTDDEKEKTIAMIFYSGTECLNNSRQRTLGAGVGIGHSFFP